MARCCNTVLILTLYAPNVDYPKDKGGKSQQHNYWLQICLDKIRLYCLCKKIHANQICHIEAKQNEK